MKLILILAITALAASAQLRDNRTKSMKCDDNQRSNRAKHCQISEQSVTSLGRWAVDAGRNGGITIRGWASSETLVRSKIEAWADTDSAASLIAGQVHSDAGSGQIRATGPETQNDTGWAVSYEIFVPHMTDLTLNAHNGGIHLSDVKGRLEFKTVNGGVHVTRAAGEINGATTNGGVHVELSGGRWEGGAVKLRTTNGGVHLTLPADASAHVKTATTNGGIHSDFPMPTLAKGERRPRNLDFNIGSGGSLIELTTTNGGVHIGKI